MTTATEVHYVISRQGRTGVSHQAIVSRRTLREYGKDVDYPGSIGTWDRDGKSCQLAAIARKAPDGAKPGEGIQPVDKK
jgi:hypothetical protein